MDLIEYKKQYRKENIEKIKEYTKQWRKDNPDKVKENKKRYRAKHPEKRVEEHRLHYLNHKEKISENKKQYYKTEQGKMCRKRGKTKRLAKEKEIINTLTSQEWLDILEQYNYRCAYCDVEFEVENMPTKDHIIPISKGGNNTKENTIPACQSCNSKKGNRILRI